MIIDVHTHLNNYDESITKPVEKTRDELLATMERNGVDYALALEFDVPVMIHTGDTYAKSAKLRYAHPLNVDDVAVDFPDLKLVICHLGNPWIRDCMEVVYKNTHAHADISGLVLGDFTSKYQKFMHKQLKDMILFAGDPNYMLYGTDWPISSMESYVKFMKSLKLDPALKELIYWRNAAALFKIPVPPEKQVPPPAPEVSGA